MKTGNSDWRPPLSSKPISRGRLALLARKVNELRAAAAATRAAKGTARPILEAQAAWLDRCADDSARALVALSQRVTVAAVRKAAPIGGAEAVRLRLNEMENEK